MSDVVHNKIIIVSGATGYLGWAVCKKLAVAGFKIAALYRNAPQELARNLLDSLTGSGHTAYKCELQNNIEAISTINKILSGQGDGPAVIYGCIHCAWSKPNRKKLCDSTLDDILKPINENLHSSYNLLTPLANLFKQQRQGVIVGVTTAGVINPQHTGLLGGYLPAKFALQGMLALYRQELAPFGVRVFSVAPDFMEGGMNKDIPRAFVEKLKQNNPTHTLVTPEEVAEKILQLLATGDEASEFTYLLSKHVF